MAGEEEEGTITMATTAMVAIEEMVTIITVVV